MNGSKTKVLFLSSCVSGGGAGRSLSTYLSQMSEQIEAHVVVPEEGVVGERYRKHAQVHVIPEFVERIHSSPYRVPSWLNFGTVHIFLNIFALIRAARKIIQLGRSIKPDLIYCNHMLANPVGSYVGKRLNLPVVFHARNIHVHGFGKWFYSHLAKRPSTACILCNSYTSSLMFREVTPEKVKVIYNFLDESFLDHSTQPVARGQLGLSKDDVLIGYVGRILPKKGVGDLILAFAKITNPKAHLIVLGENDGGLHYDLKAEYQKQCRQLEIHKRVHFIGFHNDIRPWMKSFDLLCLPSKEPESFGRVLIEAYAYGIPCITTAQGGAIEVVSHNKNGLWVMPSDVDGLHKALHQLIEHPQVRKQMGQAGQVETLEKFSAKKRAEEIDQTLLEVAQQRFQVHEEDRNALAISQAFSVHPQRAFEEYTRPST